MTSLKATIAEIIGIPKDVVKNHEYREQIDRALNTLRLSKDELKALISLCENQVIKSGKGSEDHIVLAPIIEKFKEYVK